MKTIMVDALVGNDYSLCLCSHLQNTGVDVVLIVTEDRKIDIPLNFAVKHWAPPKTQDSSNWTKIIKYIRFLYRLTGEIRQNKKNVVHFQYFRRQRIESLYFLFLRLLKVRLVYTVHDILPPENRKIDRLLAGIVYRSAHRLIAHSETVKRRLLQTFNLPGEKVAVIPHGNFDLYLPDHRLPPAEARHALNLSPRDFVLLFFGYIREYKGLDILLKAFEQAAQRDNNLKLVISGAPHTAELAERYEKAISELSCRGRIVYHPQFIPSEDVPEYFLAADIVVLPYKNIYHSGVTHLAYSFGKPVIATRVGDFEEVIEEGRCGYLLPENNSKSLADVILKAASEPEKVRKMGDYARRRSNEKYTWETSSQKTRELYTTL